jgi:hypothetical protein
MSAVKQGKKDTFNQVILSREGHCYAQYRLKCYLSQNTSRRVLSGDRSLFISRRMRQKDRSFAVVPPPTYGHQTDNNAFNPHSLVPAPRASVQSIFS